MHVELDRIVLLDSCLKMSAENTKNSSVLLTETVLSELYLKVCVKEIPDSMHCCVIYFVLLADITGH
jgi:hypothetical protein